MKTAVVTDGKYRASLAAVRALGRAKGFRVVVTQTKGDALPAAPASFLSRYAAETRWIGRLLQGRCLRAELAGLAGGV
ncbi:MAG: hypothetical protein ACLUNZ_12180 [Evtepia sp.]